VGARRNLHGSSLVVPGRCPPHCHSGAGRHLPDANPESQSVLRCLEIPMLGFRVRSRRLLRRSRPQANQLVCLGMTVWGGKTASKHLFLYPVDNISVRFIFPSSCPTERGDRDRHVRGAGCGGRRRCGVTRFGVTSVFGQDESAPALPLARRRLAFGWKDSLDSVTDDQIETCPAYSLEAPFPSPWDFNSAIGAFVEAKCKQPKKHRRRNVGHSLGASESPDALSIAEDRIRIRPKGATGTRRSARPLTGAGNANHDGAPRAANNGGDNACLKNSGCLIVESAMTHRR
jgi:hypothetical protein